MPTYGWDILKYKIAKKIVDGGSYFRMTFGGSSVTAGHDNWYNESWPFVFERRMSKIFDTLGVELQVHNIAQGANNCRPSIYCYEAMGGFKPDWIGWEQSFNCGRSRDIFELFARIAYEYEAVAFYTASGAFLPKECDKSTDKIPWTFEEWTPEIEGITDKYTMSPEGVAKHKLQQNSWFDDGNAVSRFTSIYGPLYKGVGPHGFSVWGHSSTLCNNGTGCTAIDVKGPCQSAGGPHWMVQETAWYARDPEHHGKEWHPPSGMHLLRGETLAWNYVHIIMDAIYAVEETLKNTSRVDASKLFQSKIDELRLAIPERALYLSMEDGKAAPICYTSYEPHFNPKQLLNVSVVGIANSTTDNPDWVWKPHLTKLDPDFKKYGYKDIRPFYEAQGPNKEIYVRIHDCRQGAIRVCGYAAKESLRHALFLLDKDISISPETGAMFRKSCNVGGSCTDEKLGDSYVPTADRTLLETRKYMADECTQVWNVPPGEHVLTIRTDPDHPAHTSSFSHIIIF